MKKLSKKLILAMGILFNLSVFDSVSAAEYGIKVNGSTLGTGIEFDIGFDSKWGIRLQQNSFDLDDDFEEDDIEYSGAIELSTLGVLIDWHPFNGSFRLSGGYYQNENKLRGQANESGIYDIGDRSYLVAPGDPINVSLDVELGSSTAPYLGFGWGSSPQNKGGLLFSFDLGVMMSGTPSVSLDVSGTATDLTSGFTVDLASDSIVQNEVQNEIESLEEDISDFDVYPVIMFGLGYRF